MLRKIRSSLSLQILVLAAVNVLLIVIVIAVFAQWQFGLNVESIALGPARDRISAIANEFVRDLDTTPFESRIRLLSEYSRRYGVDVLLVGPRGDSLSSTPADLPPQLLGRLRVLPPAAAAGTRRPHRRAGANLHQGEMGETWPQPEVPNPPGRPVRPGDPGFIPLGDLAHEPFMMMTRSPWFYWIAVRIPTPGPDGQRGVPGILLLRTNSLLKSRLFFEWRLLFMVAVILAAIAVLCWVPFLHRLTRSIRQMGAVTEQIALGRFETMLRVGRSDELGRLAEQINVLAVRLKGFVNHQKRFLGDVAHELCSPIARIQFALGILEQKADVAQEGYLSVLRDEIQEMTNLINELLMFSKASMQAPETSLRPVELAAVVRNAIAHQLPGSGAIEMSIPREVTVLAHEPYLLRAVSNLLRNGLRYAGAYGPISVNAQCTEGRVLLSVTDSGPGVPADAIDDVFQPFYRPESSRSREGGGAGLGLAIVKSCIEACGGTVACRNREPAGLEVTISLAAAQALAARP